LGGLILLFSGCFLFKKQLGINKSSPVTLESPKDTEEANRQAALVSTKAMTCNHRTLENGDSLRIYLELDIPRLAKIDGREIIQRDFMFNYGILPNYAGKEFIETRLIKPTLSDISKRGDLYYLQFSVIKKPMISGVIILDIVDTKSGEKLLHDFLLPFTVTKLREQYSLFDKNGAVPYFSNYFLDKDTIQINNVNRSRQSMIVRHYDHNFEAANPPMMTTEKIPIKNLQVDSVFTIESGNGLNFTKSGLYLVQTDTSQYYGLSFYVSDRKYPKLSKIADVIEPLRYITTDDELNQLRNAKDVKAELDKFWLKLLNGNVRLAKQTIKEYFQRVRFANQFFTTYKEGWKTDMGMIFIVYGRPDRVIRNNEAEYWFYSQNAKFSEIKFTFARRPNQFSDESYSLIRYQEYEQVWYPMVEMWREGKIQ
jgi:GWxTD domain-containing protein